MARILLLLLLAATPLHASPVQSALTDATLRGTATFRHLGFPIYEARLYTPGGAALDWRADMGLELEYLRALSGDSLVTATLREFDRTGGPLPVEQALRTCFRDVRRGDRYLAVSDGRDRLRFWRNDQPACTIDHPGIAPRFLGIFLGENTRSRAFTRQLRGE